MLEYIQVYADSTESDDPKEKGSEKARELYKYLGNNREGLVPYQARGIELPEAPEGIVYKNMGVQEKQNCRAVTIWTASRKAFERAFCKKGIKTN